MVGSSHSHSVYLAASCVFMIPSGVSVDMHLMVTRGDMPHPQACIPWRTF